MQTRFVSAAVLLLTVAPVVGQHDGAGSPWLTDVAKARALAQQKGLDVLLEFTGSDWCHWCKRLRDEVLGTGAFLASAQRSFVLVTLDFPHGSKLPAELERQNLQLQAQLGITAFPTLVLTDAQGRPYAQTGYLEGGPERYLKHLARLQKKKERRDQAFAKADRLQGGERAVALSSVLDALDDPLRRHYGAVMDEIVALDADNVLGLRAQVEKERGALALEDQVAALEQRLEALLAGEDYSGVLAAVERFCAERNPKGRNLQRLLVCESAARAGQLDFAAACTTAKAALAAAPEGETAGVLRARIAELERLTGAGPGSRRSR